MYTLLILQRQTFMNPLESGCPPIRTAQKSGQFNFGH